MATISSTKNFIHLRGQVKPASCLIAVGGGKGGVGKSFVSSSLAIFLAHMGYETNLIDLDLGAANLHTYLGVTKSSPSLQDFVLNRDMNIRDAFVDTHWPKLRLMNGATDNFDIADIDNQTRSRLMSSIFHLPGDFTILDLSAGTHSTTLDFFLMAQRRLIAITPEPSSIENAYRFMKACFYRKVRRFEFQLHLEKVITDIMRNRHDYKIKCPSDLLELIRQKDFASGERLSRLMQGLTYDIILNQVRTRKDIELGPSIEMVCKKYFGTPSQFLGHVDHDNAVWQSLRKRKHLLIEYPHSPLYIQLLNISRQLVNDHFKKAAV